MKVKELYIYPIKSCRGISVKKAEVTPKGFLWDRELMLVDSEGNFLTQRQYPLLATIEVNITDDTLTLSVGDNFSSQKYQESVFSFKPTFSGKEVKVKIWGDRTIAIDQGDAIADWFHKALRLPSNLKCRLVRQSNRYIRAIDRKYRTKSNQFVSFADGYPFLLTNTASLAELNHRLQEKYPQQNQQVPMNRFRPNIVIETDQPFIESTWQTIKIGEVIFSIVKPCTRCIVTTTNQITGERNLLNEPLAILSSFRQVKNQGIMFGENMIPENLGIIEIDNQLKIGAI
jgi:uncharacterized protein YcbX